MVLRILYSRKPEFIKLEIWAKLIAYHAAELLIHHAVVEKHDTKYPYKVNFKKAAHIYRIYLHMTTETDSIEVVSLLLKGWYIAEILKPISCIYSRNDIY